MKRLFIPAAAAALGFALAVPAQAAPGAANTHATTAAPQMLAQMQDKKRDQKRKQPMTKQREQQRGRQQMQERQRQIRRNQTIIQRDRKTLQNRVQDRTRTKTRAQQRYDWNQYKAGRRPTGWKRAYRFDPKLWQRNFRATKRFHWRAYHRPHGWYYRRWSFGMILPAIFWTRTYWIDSYWVFGLMNPPYGYVWVRYGDDAILVNVHTGLILRVVYHVFY